MPTLRTYRWLVLLLPALAVFLYADGLDGPFLFDDHVHITQNRWVKITALDPPSLAQAWHSSFSAFPGDRPLAQLSFGINHALSGLEPRAFKATNLALHLLSGLLVYVFTRLAYRALTHGAPDPARENLVALAAAAFWLLNPLHVSTVLYTVQRMAQLSTLALLAAMSSYLWGRLQISAGRPGAVWMLAAAPIALLGFFGKENAVLLPLLLLVCELTLLRRVGTGDRRRLIHAVWVAFIALPLLLGAWYLATHPALTYYDQRPFTLVERVLTQPRVLWLYLRLLLVPDITAFGLFHDDLAYSRDLLTPVSTLFAILAWVGVVGAAIALRRRAPVFAFAVLFFLAAHALESSVIALEMVFEHRNYLASVGPLFLLAHLVTVTAARLGQARLAAVLAVLLLSSHAAVTYLRVDNWSSYGSFLLSSADNHPDSPRSNFMAAQFLITALDKAEGDTGSLVSAARSFLDRGLAADDRCINCLFGLVVLDLYRGQTPDSALVERLADALRAGYVGPTKVSISQFSFLVKWHRSDGAKLAPGDLEKIFDAALANPRWNHTGRAGIETAYREYHEHVSGDLDAALRHARAAVAAWPEQWSYHMYAVRLLQRLGRHDEALAALDRAAGVAGNQSQQRDMAELRAEFEHARTN